MTVNSSVACSPTKPVDVVLLRAQYMAAFERYCADGWITMTQDPRWGGQGLPGGFALGFSEMLISGNMAWKMYSGLTESAAHTIAAHASEDLKARYLPKMVAGGLDASFFIVYVGQGSLTAEGYDSAYKQALAKFDAIHLLTEKLAPDKIELALTAADVRRINKAGKKVALIGVENGYPLGDASTAIARVMSPWVTAVDTSAIARSCVVSVRASWLTLSVRSFHTPETPSTFA